MKKKIIEKKENERTVHKILLDPSTEEILLRATKRFILKNHTFFQLFYFILNLMNVFCISDMRGKNETHKKFEYFRGK